MSRSPQEKQKAPFSEPSKGLRGRVRRAPTLPGVYFFKNAHGSVLYIGKAANLRSRLRSYFAPSADLPPTKRALLREAKRLAWHTTANDVEALIEEARLVKEGRPKYNVLLRDDKNYFFVGFTKEPFPRIFLTHQPGKTADSQIRRLEKRERARQSASQQVHQSAAYIGPFTDGGAIKRTLRLLRRTFPYATHPGFPKRCLEYDLGLCPIPPTTNHHPPTTAFLRRYRRNIRAISEVLKGKRQTLLRRLERTMRRAAAAGDFEKAAQYRDEIRGLERIFAHRTVVTGAEHLLVASDIPPSIRKYLTTVPPARIEGYDIANLARGKAATGSMVVFTNGKPDPSAYRQFRIRSVRGANDVAMLAEVLRRRLNHPEWPIPDIVLIDGGRPQLNAALAVLRDLQPTTDYRQHDVIGRGSLVVSRPLMIALAKRLEELYVPGRAKPLRLAKRQPFLQLLMHIRDEAHRFARRYHFRLRLDFALKRNGRGYGREKRLGGRRAWSEHSRF